MPRRSRPSLDSSRHRAEQSGPQIPSRQPSWPQHHGVLLQQRGARALARLSLLDVLAQPDRGVLTTPGDSMNAVAFSPDGKTLATVGSNSRIRLWDIATRRPTRQADDRPTANP